MPDLLNRSMEDMLAAMAARFGARWPNDWWPHGNPTYDDCAACVSYFLFGLNSYGNPFYSYVSQLQNYFAAQGRRTWGNGGIQRGDILAFSWTQDRDSFDHTEIALGPVSPMGLITSRGTNSNPGDDLRDRTRSAAYVVSYSRPAYPGTSTAGGGAKPITKPKEVKVMKSYPFQDALALREGRTVKPGASFYLNTDPKAPTSQASNIVGVVGQYAITTHLYVEGTPGDTVDLVLVWQNQGVKPLTNSDHYVETVMIGSTGKAKTSTTFQRYVKSLDAVYLRATAGAGNKADVKVTRLDSDAVAFTVA